MDSMDGKMRSWHEPAPSARRRRRFRMLRLNIILAYGFFALVTAAIMWAIRELMEPVDKSCEWKPWSEPQN
jgi:hypothetical protein